MALRGELGLAGVGWFMQDSKTVERREGQL